MKSRIRAPCDNERYVCRASSSRVCWGTRPPSLERRRSATSRANVSSRCVSTLDIWDPPHLNWRPEQSSVTLLDAFSHSGAPNRHAKAPTAGGRGGARGGGCGGRQRVKPALDRVGVFRHVAQRDAGGVGALDAALAGALLV